MPSFARRAAVVLVLAMGLGAAALLAPSASAVTRSTVSLSPHHRTIHFDRSAALVARLRGILGPLSDHRVTFWSRHGKGGWHRFAAVRTNSHGVARIRPRLTRTTQWQARFSGNLIDGHARSPIRTVTVLPPPAPRRGHDSGGLPLGTRAVREAARHKGAPYEYGAAGPHRFDCSGFTMYVFARFGRHLSHNAAAQYDEVMHVRASHKKLGDLIFFYDNSGIYHVGIFAGHHAMWAATHTGDYVRKESIYNGSYVVGRVR